MTECSPTEVYQAPVESCSSSSDAPPSAEDDIDILKVGVKPSCIIKVHVGSPSDTSHTIYSSLRSHKHT